MLLDPRIIRKPFAKETPCVLAAHGNGWRWHHWHLRPLRGGVRWHSAGVQPAFLHLRPMQGPHLPPGWHGASGGAPAHADGIPEFQSCLDKFLRSNKLDKSRKTGFKCPRGCGKGSSFSAACPGRVSPSRSSTLHGNSHALCVLRRSTSPIPSSLAMRQRSTRRAQSTAAAGLCPPAHPSLSPNRRPLSCWSPSRSPKRSKKRLLRSPQQQAKANLRSAWAK